MRVAKSSTARNVAVLLIGSADHITGLAGATLTITASKNGGAFAATTPVVTDLGSGWYNLALTATDTNTLGDLALHITAASADPQDILMQVVAYDPTSATNLGLTNLDAAITTRMATYVQPTGFLAATFPGTVGSSTYAGGAVASVTAPVTVGTNNDKTGYALSAAGVQAVWDALTSALTTVGSIGKLLVTNVDALISSRSTYAGADTAGTTTLLSRITGLLPLAADYSIARAAKLDNLDATVSSRSTYAGGDTAGTTSLLARLTLTRAGNLDNLDAPVSGIAAAVWAATTRTLSAFGFNVTVADGSLTTVKFAVGAIDATVLAGNAEQAIADKVMATAVDGTITHRQMMQLLGAALAGKASGAGTTSITFRDVNDTRNCIVATVDASGNRSALTLTVV